MPLVLTDKHQLPQVIKVLGNAVHHRVLIYHCWKRVRDQPGRRPPDQAAAAAAAAAWHAAEACGGPSGAEALG